MDWFFGFQPHLLMNHKGQAMAFKARAGHTDDGQPLEALTAALRGKVFADQGYLSQWLLVRLWQRGLHLVTSVRRNRTNDLLPLLDKALLRKRCIIETLFEVLKSTMSLESTAHPPPLPRQCPGPRSLLSGRLHPATAQGQHRQHPHPHHPNHSLTLSRIEVK